MTRIAILGATGYVGQGITTAMRKLEADLGAGQGTHRLDSAGCRFDLLVTGRRWEMLSPHAKAEIIGSDVAIWCEGATPKSGRTVDDLWDGNLVSYCDFVQALGRRTHSNAHRPVLVLTSSIACAGLGDPLVRRTPEYAAYARAKRMQEELLLLLHATERAIGLILRLGTVVGGAQDAANPPRSFLGGLVRDGLGCGTTWTLPPKGSTRHFTPMSLLQAVVMTFIEKVLSRKWLPLPLTESPGPLEVVDGRPMECDQLAALVEEHLRERHIDPPTRVWQPGDVECVSERLGLRDTTYASHLGIPLRDQLRAEIRQLAELISTRG